MSAPDETPKFDAGSAGGSARREYDRRRAGRQARTRLKHRWIGGLLVALREGPDHERAWARGAEGEERLGRRLGKLLADRAVLLHDRAIPGSRANIDHIAVAPSGIWVIDTKRYKGKVSVVKPLLRPEKLIIAGRDKSALADGLASQVASVRSATPGIGLDVPVHGAFCFVDAELPVLGRHSFRGYPLLYPRGLARRIKARGALPPDQLQAVAAYLASRFPAA